MHECLSVQDWIKLWGDPENGTHRLAECPRCWPLREDLTAWSEAVAACESCQAALETSLLSEESLNCPACMESFAKLHELVDGLEHFDPAIAPEILAAEEMAAKLDRLPLPARVARVTDDLRYQQWGLAQHLLGASRELWCSDPDLAHGHATVAAAVADLVDAATYHPLWVADLRAKAHAYLANTYRILAEFRDAEREFLTAETFSWRGTGSGQTRAVVFSLKASLLIDQRRFVEAGALLELVLAHYEVADDAEALARTCLQLAIVEKGREEYTAAAALCARALSYLDPNEHGRLWALAMVQEASVLLVRGAARHEAIAMLRVLLTAMERGMADRALVLTLARRIAALKPSG